jgi:hypothetical protein
MNYGDFSNLVQLGVGLHAGTALLQLYGQIGEQPLIQVLGRTRSLFQAPESERPAKHLEEELARLERRYEIFKIQFFQEYQKYVQINSGVAIALAVILVIISYKSSDKVGHGYTWLTVLMCALSLLPAPSSLFMLWMDANQQVKPMKMDAEDLERRCLAAK